MSDWNDLLSKDGTFPVLRDVGLGRIAQDKKWGQQNHPDGTGPSSGALGLADAFRSACEQAFASGIGTWRDILLEEVYEALAESDPAKLREELVQVAAVAAAWCEAIDRRAA